MLSRASVVLPLILLAACGTPQEQCIRRETGELRKVERLLAEVEGNLARGYSYEEETITTWGWDYCVVDVVDPANPKPVARMCWEPEEETIRREVPIDPAAERRKLDGLVARRKALRASAAPAIAACQASYPE